MRKFFLWISVVVLLFVSILFLYKQNPSSEKTSLPHLQPKPSQVLQPNIKKIQKTIFVPYWTLGTGELDVSPYTTIIYFGVTASKDGLDTTSIGYKSINNFISQTPAHAHKLLGIQLINTDFNRELLKDDSLQRKIIQQSIVLARAKGFDGIVLDFELSALGFDSVTNSVTSLEVRFGDAVRKEHLSFIPTLYGDTFARFRPYDVKKIASYADTILIMAYDFHKANGGPGPNFPLKDNQHEGYDFQTMIGDFLQQVPPQKITVVFGMFGYDWMVDDKGNTLGQASSLSDYKIAQKFLQSCPFPSCMINRDTTAAETTITYFDGNHKHIVWYEDSKSVDAKTRFLVTKGIDAIGYWAYSYF